MGKYEVVPYFALFVGYLAEILTVEARFHPRVLHCCGFELIH
jgi:hypothetical protein